jgi:hypothetical protein
MEFPSVPANCLLRPCHQQVARPALGALRAEKTAIRERRFPLYGDRERVPLA